MKYIDEIRIINCETHWRVDTVERSPTLPPHITEKYRTRRPCRVLDTVEEFVGLDPLEDQP